MNQPEIIECPDCEGLGKLEPRGELSFLCLKCNGKGRIEAPRSPAKVMQGPLDGAGKCSSIINELHEKASVLDQSWRHLIQEEMTRAKSKFPEWPTDPIHAFAIIAEECGEAHKDVLQLVYEPEKTSKERLKKEVIQLAAMCHRFLMSFDEYDFKPSAQHRQ